MSSTWPRGRSLVLIKMGCLRGASSLYNNDLQQTRRFASNVSGVGSELRRDQGKRALAGRAAEISGVMRRTQEFNRAWS